MSTSAPAAADRTPETAAMTGAEHRAPFRPECRGVLRSLTHLVASQGGCLPVQPILAAQAAFRGLSRGPQSAPPCSKAPPPATRRCGGAARRLHLHPRPSPKQECKHQQQMEEQPHNPMGSEFIESHRSADYRRHGESGAYRRREEIRGNAWVAWAAGGAGQPGRPAHRWRARRRRDPRPKQPSAIAPFRNPRPSAANAQEKRGAARSHGVPWRRVTGPDLWPHEREAVEHGGPGAQRARQAVAEKTWLASGVLLQRSHVSFPGNGVPRGLPLHGVYELE